MQRCNSSGAEDLREDGATAPFRQTTNPLTASSVAAGESLDCAGQTPGTFLQIFLSQRGAVDAPFGAYLGPFFIPKTAETLMA